MADDKGRKGRLLQSVGVTLLLFYLAPSFTCFGLQRLSKTVQQQKRVNEAAATDVRTGRILFNGKEVNFRSRSFSVAPKDDRGLEHVDLPQSDGTDLLMQPFQLETPQEAAWKRLNPLLSCGQTKMKLKAMGPGAADLQLDMGVFNGLVQTLPLMQVPSSCGYATRQNALGVILVVPYDGCGVLQENGYYVLPLSWLQNPVKLACPASQTADASRPPTTTQPTTTPTPSQTIVTAPAMNLPANPNYPYFPYPPFYPGFGWQQPTVAPDTSATSSQPFTTTTMTAPTTATPPAANPPANVNYPYFPYAPFPFPAFGWPQPTVAPATTAQPTTTAQLSTTIMQTTGPAQVKLPVYPNYLNPYQQYPYFVWNTPDALSNVPLTTTMPPTTTAASPTTGLPAQPNPYYSYYPAGVSSQSALYYPYVQPPYPQNPAMGCSTDSDPSPTTPSASTSACPDKMTSSGSSYLDLMSQYYSYNWFPFRQHMWYDNGAGNFPYGWKNKPNAGYIPGIQTRVQPHPGFLYQQPLPWFSYLGQETPQVGWRNSK